VLDGISFEWDENNIMHIARHGIGPEEIEEIFERPNIIEPSPRPGETRFRVFGVTAKGRFVVVVFTLRGKRIRPISAYPMNRSVRRLYAAKITGSTKVQE
jgi:uncharacterized protein